MFTFLIPPDSTILVTGVNGYIASHVANELLGVGYKVTGTVRSRSRGEALLQYFEQQYGTDRFTLAVVEDITQEGAFDKILEGISGIVHVATAAIFATNANEVIPSTVAGALNIFKAAEKISSVKSIVYTSDSFTALLPESNKSIRVAQSTYNEDSVAASLDPSSADRLRKTAWDPSIAAEINVYAAAKVAAEKATWRFVADEKPHFQVCTILPNVNIGASVGGLPLSSTGTFVPSLLEGRREGLMFPAQHYINVRDCARLHVAALRDRGARDQRLFAMAGPFNWNDVLALLRQLRPEAEVMEDMPDLGRDLSVLPNNAAERLLRKHFGHGWTSLEESVRQNVDSL